MHSCVSDVAEKGAENRKPKTELHHQINRNRERKKSETENECEQTLTITKRNTKTEVNQQVNR